MFVITKDNPFYPSVQYRETLDEARTVAAEFYADMSGEGGIYECHITIAKVVEDRTIRTDY